MLLLLIPVNTSIEDKKINVLDATLKLNNQSCTLYTKPNNSTRYADKGNIISI